MLCRALTEFLGIDADWSASDILPKPGQPQISLSDDLSEFQAISSCMHRVYDIASDDRRMRDTFDLPATERGQAFDHLRKNYPVRRECSAYQIDKASINQQYTEMFKSFGFELV
jgi:erythronate-4-phosphate dehydrogenase